MNDKAQAEHNESAYPLIADMQLITSVAMGHKQS